MTDVPNATEPGGPEQVLVLRVCKADLTSYGGFQWPESGFVSAPDWVDDNSCGHGLHGWLWGEGDISVATIEPDSKWLVLRVLREDFRDLGGKVKFPNTEILHVGDQSSSTNFLYPLAPPGTAIIGLQLATTGSWSNASTTGSWSNASTTGSWSNASTTGEGSNASTTGSWSNASTTGEGSVSVALGHSSMASAWTDGAVVLIDRDGDRPRVVVGYVGEDGIEAETLYMLVAGKLVAVRSGKAVLGE